MGPFVGTRLSFPIVVADDSGYGNTLPVSPILRASNYTSLRTRGGGYVFDVHLYTGRRGKVHRFGSCCGKYDAKGIMRLWARMIPESTVLFAESFFGSHGLAEEFAAQRRPFLMLSKRDKRHAALTRAAALTQEGDMARAIVANKNYELAV